MPVDLAAAFENGLGRIEERARSAAYQDDPVGWARDKLGVHLWSKQREISESVVQNRRTAIRSSHGAGKSYWAAVMACWWVDTHPPGKTMVISTAPSYDQIHGVLWENIRELHRDSGLRGTVQQSDRWVDEDGRLLGFGRRPPDHADSAFSGYHRPFVLMIIDEAGGIPEWLWNIAEALTTGDDCRVVAIGNPTDSASHFAKLRGSQVWATFQISTFDTPRFTGEIEEYPAEIREQMREALPSPKWEADAKVQWGEASSLYRVRVLGEFADRDDGLIPLSWVAQANQRWRNWYDLGQHEPGGRRIIGVDPAWLGDDLTAIAIREADVIRSVRTWPKLDTVAVTDLVTAELEFPQSESVVDVIGVGAGVVDQLRAGGHRVTPFNGSKPTKWRDASNQWRFRNVRAASWYNGRQLLDPALGSTLCIPPDDLLEAELTTPNYRDGGGGYYYIESKDEMRKRLGRSPDRADCVIQALWHNPSTGRQTPDENRPPAPRVHAYDRGGSTFGDDFAGISGGWG